MSEIVTEEMLSAAEECYNKGAFPPNSRLPIWDAIYLAMRKVAKSDNWGEIDIMNRRIGKFKIEMKTINAEPEVAKAILRDCIVFRAEANLADDTIDYLAVHESFSHINKGQSVTNYVAEIKETRLVGHYEVKWLLGKDASGFVGGRAS